MIYISGSVTHAELIRENVFDIMMCVYPELLVLFVISWFIRNRNNYSTKKLFSIVLNDDRKTLTNVILLICFQFCLLGSIQLILSTSDSYNPFLNGSLILITITVSVLALVSIIRLLVRTREQVARMTQEVYVEEINDMFTSIRGQRHDFLNHMQVMHTMSQMGKNEQLNTYISELVKETRSVSDIVHHSSPALAAFAQSKTTVAIGKGIGFTCELPDNWNMQETTVKVIDIIKIIGNLVDNAFDETETLPQNQRQVHASIRIDERNRIELLVSNRGRHLSDKDKDRMFAPGYTSKGNDHSGLGLAIVQERVKHYNGSLEVQSEENPVQAVGTTIFRITLPQAQT
ncbi:sensor histidine kinase [Cohnella endophytica]|nr:ATP-binding protein [Cohnella endophytica]